MNYVLWTAAGWAAVSVLTIPLIVRFCRCMARFDPPLEQIAAAATGTDVLPALAGHPVTPPGHGRVIERRSGFDRRSRRDDELRRRRRDDDRRGRRRDDDRGGRRDAGDPSPPTATH